MSVAEDVRYVVVSTAEDVSLRVDSSAYVIELDGLTDDERELLGESDSFGWYGPEAAAVVSRVGVPVSDVLAMWKRARGGLSLELTHELGAICEARDWEALEDFVARNGYDESHGYCPNCGAPLDAATEVTGWPCGPCTAAHPVGEWASRWEVGA